MNLGRVLEVKPLLVAAVIGAVGYALLRRRFRATDPLLGAALGIAVQVGVRFAGVS